MLHKPLDCLLWASPPGQSIYCYLQRDRTRRAPPRNPRQRRAGNPLLPASRRTGDSTHSSAGQPGASVPGAGGGRGQRRVAVSGVCGQVIRDPPARAAQRSPPGPAPPGRPPFLPPLSAGLPGRETASLCGASGPCPPRAVALGHRQPLLPRGAGDRPLT